jgi:uncharacterized damage-inducible protein DinB
MLKRLIRILLFVCVILLPSVTPAQTSAAANEPISAAVKLWYGASRNNIIAAAQKMPEADFSFRPTPEVRSFSELLGHIADTQYTFCSQLKGEANPTKDSPLNPGKSKAEIVEAVKAAFSYCDKPFSGLTDAALKEKVGTQGDTRVDWAMFSVYHLGSHYGNIVTYLRLKGLVPPNSERSAPEPQRREKP